MQNTQSTTIVYSLQAVLVLSLMFMMLSAAIFGGIVYVHNQTQSAAPRKPSGSLGTVGSMTSEAIEATYGPVNQKALHETKEGLFARIRAARQGCSPCVPPRPQVYYSPVSRCYTTSYSYCASTAPVVVPSYPAVIHPIQPAITPQPAPSQPPVYVQPTPLKIQPSSESNCADGSCSPNGSVQSSADLTFKPSVQ
jgi:hypothetical protein